MAFGTLPGMEAGGGGFSGSSSAHSGGNPYLGGNGPVEINFGGSKFGIGEAVLLIAVLIGAAMVLKR